MVSRSTGVTTTTSLDGSFRFSSIGVGSYAVHRCAGGGLWPWAAQTARWMWRAAAQRGRTSACRRRASSGLVFDDRNGNGVQDNGETGIGGATVARSGGDHYRHRAGRHLPSPMLCPASMPCRLPCLTVTWPSARQAAR